MLAFLEHWEPVVVFLIFVSDLVGTIFLIAEYFWGRPDIALKHERQQRKRLRVKKEELTAVAVVEPTGEQPK